MTLTTREKTFCQIYAANGGDGIRAAIAAGYSAESANAEAARLLTENSVTNYIEILMTVTETVIATPTKRRIFSDSFRTWINSK